VRHQDSQSSWFDPVDELKGQCLAVLASDLVEIWAALTGKIDLPLVVDFLMLSEAGHPREQNPDDDLPDVCALDPDGEGEEWKRAG